MKTARSVPVRLINRKRVTVLLMGLILSFGSYYAVLINQTILNAVEQRKIEGSIGKIQKDIADLQLAFITNENNVNLDHARTLGFKEVNTRNFVSRNSSFTLR